MSEINGLRHNILELLKIRDALLIENAALEAEVEKFTSTNNRVMKPCAKCSSGPLDTCDKLCLHNVTFNDLFTPRKAS